MKNALCYIIISEPKGGADMKLSVEQISHENEEEVIVRCYDTQEKWVEAIRAVTAGEVSVSAFAEKRVYRLRLSDVYYFEVVDGSSFLYCEKAVYECRQKLYEFEELCRSATLFGGFGYVILLFAGFMLLPGWILGFCEYISCFVGVNLLLSVWACLWLRKKGAARFSAL